MQDTIATPSVNEGERPTPCPSDIEGNLSLDLHARDPYIDECPVWCDSQHLVTRNEDDRKHYGPAFFVPIRTLPTTYLQVAGELGEIAFSDLCVSLERPALHRDPRIRLESHKTPALKLSIEEAQQIADCLLSLIKESQR